MICLGAGRLEPTPCLARVSPCPSGKTAGRKSVSTGRASGHNDVKSRRLIIPHPGCTLESITSESRHFPKAEVEECEFFDQVQAAGRPPSKQIPNGSPSLLPAPSSAARARIHTHTQARAHARAGAQTLPASRPGGERMPLHKRQTEK